MIKIFKMNLNNYYAGESLLEIMMHMSKQPGELKIDDPYELLPEDLHNLTVTIQEPSETRPEFNCRQVSFKEYLDGLIKTGQVFPCHFVMDRTEGE